MQINLLLFFKYITFKNTPFLPKRTLLWKSVGKENSLEPKFIFGELVGHSFSSLLHNRPLQSSVASNCHPFIASMIFWLRNWGMTQQGSVASAGAATRLEVAGTGAAGLSSVLAVGWVPQSCLLESGRAELHVRASNARERPEQPGPAGLTPSSPLHSLCPVSVGFLTLGEEARWASAKTADVPQKECSKRKEAKPLRLF